MSLPVWFVTCRRLPASTTFTSRPERAGETVVAACPVPVQGRLVLDLGAGTGAASRALLRSGASVVAVDNAIGMLLAVAGFEATASAGAGPGPATPPGVAATPSRFRSRRG